MHFEKENVMGQKNEEKEKDEVGKIDKESKAERTREIKRPESRDDVIETTVC